MPEMYQRPYLDSSVFIAHIKNEVVQDVRRGEIANNILNDAQNGRFQIHTSTFTLAEVHKDRGRPRLSVEEEQLVTDFFNHEYIILIDLDRLVAERARELARTYNLTPNDAVHLASAIRAGVDQLLVWDDGFPKVTVDGVQVVGPHWQGQPKLPEPS